MENKILTANDFQSKYNFPTLTNFQFQNEKLSGIFMASENIEIARGVFIKKDSFVFLNNGVLGRNGLPSKVVFLITELNFIIFSMGKSIETEIMRLRFMIVKILLWIKI